MNPQNPSLPAVDAVPESTTAEPDVPRAGRTFPIVGIGASAGGLEALELFLSEVPADCGLAFVVVQHLDPAHKTLMPELLQRNTPLPVAEVVDRVTVKPGHVYIIPPNRDLSLLHGVLHLLEPVAPHGLRLPIDFFFRSLADDQAENSIGVILSGMGSDGTLGLRAIKAKAGAVFVQDPATAKFNAMPHSAVEAGLADVVAPAEELPARIAAYLAHRPLREGVAEQRIETEQAGLEKVVILLRAQMGHDFSHYKRSTIYRRIERRMGLHQLALAVDYVRYLRENPQEVGLLFKELLIGVTSFFRDGAVWEELKNEVIPALLATRPLGGVLRAWTAGCSTGEEAYSLAIIFREALEEVKPTPSYTLQVFATDLDKDAIEKARAGLYPANIVADVSEERLRRFFVPDERGYRVSKEIREMVIFAPQNVVMDPPFTKLDLLTCRNLLIYLEAPLQQRLLRLFHYSLKPGGVLVLGGSSTIGGATELFAPLPGKNRIYRRLEVSLRPDLVDFPAAFLRGEARAPVVAVPEVKAAVPAAHLQLLADQVLLQQFSPAAVLVTEKGDIVYVSGKTGRYLEPAAGKANWNLFAMAREGLAAALIEAFHKAVRKQEAVVVPKVRVGTDGGPQFVDIAIQPLATPETLRGMVMVIFTAVKKPAAAPKLRDAKGRAVVPQARLDEVLEELRRTAVEVQTLREERQGSQEELRSANEELQSANEELQSTNEELTTSKEEMQSMNEELQTVNHELQAKLDELSQASNDMKNLLNSTSIATLFLDSALRIRRFTAPTTSLFKLIPGDAGRMLSDIVSELEYPGLSTDAQAVLRTLAFIEKEVAAHDGRWFTVRIMPYRTTDSRIDGLVITFHDISTNKKLEAELRTAQAALQVRFADQTVELGQARSDLREQAEESATTAALPKNEPKR